MFESQNGNIKDIWVHKRLCKVHLKKQLYGFKMDKGGDIKGYENKFRLCIPEFLRTYAKRQDGNQAMIFFIFIA